MQVGDLVTLSAAGKKIEEIRLTHRRWFKANASKYGRMTKAEQISWLDYWENDKMLGMIQRVEKKYRRLWNYEQGRWEVPEDTEKLGIPPKVFYYVRWFANGRNKQTKQLRQHIKYVSKVKKTS